MQTKQNPKSDVVRFAHLSYSLVAIIFENSDNHNSNGGKNNNKNTVTNFEFYIPGPIRGSKSQGKTFFHPNILSQVKADW